MDEHKGFIRAVKQVMVQHRLSARALARQVGISPSYITRIVTGKRTPPADDIIEGIAQVLGLDSDRLLMDAGRLPQFLKATWPLTDEDLDALRRWSYERIRRPHAESRWQGVPRQTRNLQSKTAARRTVPT